MTVHEDAPTVAARPRRRAVRVAVRIIVFVVIGVVITVAVAWCPIGQNALADVALPAHAASEVWSHYAPSNWHRPAREETYRGRSWNMTFDAVVDLDAAVLSQASRVRQGWPLRALEGGHYLGPHPDKNVVTQSTVALIRVEVVSVNIPTRPLWPGLLTNTAFFAAVTWLLWLAPGATRRAIRRHRNRCPACNYPVGTTDRCSECGGAVRPGS